VKGFRFAGIETARPAAGVLEAIEQAEGIIICPSNPWVSIDPILQVTGIRSALAEKFVIAVSPIIGGKSVKGPAAKMFTEMGVQPSALAVANHYGKILSCFVLDRLDENLVYQISIPTWVTNIQMNNPEDRRCLAQVVLNLIPFL
jgi:LPPG:FO 2-phospho-L-lactate transferase